MPLPGAGSVRWRFYLNALPAAVWSGVVLALAVVPTLGGLEEATLFSHQDKLYHFLEYLLLSALTAFAVMRGTRRPREWQLQVAIVYPLVLGIVLESIHAVLPYRTFSLLDLLANSIGCVTGGFAGISLLEPYALRNR